MRGKTYEEFDVPSSDDEKDGKKLITVLFISVLLSTWLLWLFSAIFMSNSGIKVVLTNFLRIFLFFLVVTVKFSSQTNFLLFHFVMEKSPNFTILWAVRRSKQVNNILMTTTRTLNFHPKEQQWEVKWFDDGCWDGTKDYRDEKTFVARSLALSLLRCFLW